MWEHKIEHDRLWVGERFSIAFQRTLRIPDDGKVYPLPPTLGAFPLRLVRKYRSNLPEHWQEDGVFFPMYQREAMWMAFGAPSWKPCAVKVAAGRVNALTGQAWSTELHHDPQDYMVVPEQPWLDGINAGEGVIRQFVAMPLGQGYTLGEQVLHDVEQAGVQLVVYDPLPGIFPERPAQVEKGPGALMFSAVRGAELGLSAGGRIRQKIYPDRYGLEVWDTSNFGEVHIYILNSAVYQQVTGEAPPPTPISAQTYTQYGLPWYALYDEAQGDLAPTETLTQVQTVHEIDAQIGAAEDLIEESFEVEESQVHDIDLTNENQPRKEPPDAGE